MARIGIDYTAAARQGAGIGRYARELVSALLRRPGDHRYTLFAAVGGLADHRWRERVAGTGVRIRTLPLSDDWMARLWHRLRLPIPVEVVTGPLDVFYSPDFVLPPTRRGTRTVLTVHDLSFLHYPQHFVPSLAAYLNRVVPRSVARADRVLADSEATRSDLIVYWDVPPEKVTVLYSGVDARFRPQPQPQPQPQAERVEEAQAWERRRLRRYGIGERPYVLSVGTIQPRKNYLRLIRAFVGLPVCAGWQLVIAGGQGWLCDDVLAEAARHGERVRITGFVADEDLPALYRQAALFVFPSLYEGFGLPVLEAMACGTPVVCSDVSSLPEVAGDAAVLVPPHDVEALAAGMERVLSDAHLRHEMIARGKARAAMFTWERAAEQLLALLEAQ